MPEANESAQWIEERRQALRKLRREIGLSQHEVAQLSGVSVWSVGGFETGARNPKMKTVEKIEAGLSDAMAGRRVTQMFRAQRIGSLSQMSPPGAGTEAYWRAREAFVQQGSRTMTNLLLQNSHLKEEVVELKKIVGILQEQARNWEESHVLESQVIRELQAEIPGEHPEVEAMLSRAKFVAGRRDQNLTQGRSE
jgi:transcriptional regulator with XRE-family HTH domain